MGVSTTSLQNVVDYIATMPNLSPLIPVGGYSVLLATNIATDVMSEMLSVKFNWKFNRIVVTPFPTISWQQDYATVNVTNVGWLEHCASIDINNTALPKPIYWPECVKDLEITSMQQAGPMKVCWLPNNQLRQGTWPGAAKVYINPIGAITSPSNNATNILDAHNNILVLTTYGTTGGSAPDAGSNPLVGATVADGSCVWTVANPYGAGFRISPLPPQTAVVYQLNPIAQAKPTKFTSMAQMIDPIPDDYSRYFIEGFITYASRHSADPHVSGTFETKKKIWISTMMQAAEQGQREKDDAGFYPDRAIMSDSYNNNAVNNPFWPFGPYGTRG